MLENVDFKKRECADKCLLGHLCDEETPLGCLLLMKLKEDLLEEAKTGKLAKQVEEEAEKNE